MAGIDVAVEKNHGDRLDVFAAADRGGGVDVLLVKRGQHVAPCIEPLVDFQAEPPGDEGGRRARLKIVQIGTVAAGDLEHVAKALGGHQRGLDPLALGNRIDHRCSAVHEKPTSRGSRP